jgi:hypothetical protein
MVLEMGKSCTFAPQKLYGFIWITVNFYSLAATSPCPLQRRGIAYEQGGGEYVWAKFPSFGGGRGEVIVCVNND